jgi:hypothetical protein
MIVLAHNRWVQSMLWWLVAVWVYLLHIVGFHWRLLLVWLVKEAFAVLV